MPKFEAKKGRFFFKNMAKTGGGLQLPQPPGSAAHDREEKKSWSFTYQTDVGKPTREMCS